jgi:hypothetical protein
LYLNGLFVQILTSGNFVEEILAKADERLNYQLRNGREIS